jgi:hypothetical protein
MIMKGVRFGDCGHPSDIRIKEDILGPYTPGIAVTMTGCPRSAAAPGSVTRLAARATRFATRIHVGRKSGIRHLITGESI